uniref:Granulins-like n=1 Tax=Sinocyclocheilus grahami TaxID=75366 RepID=A0A672LR88_SINGR
MFFKCSANCVRPIFSELPYGSKIWGRTPAPSLDLDAVKCDEQSSCSADSTCCYLSTGERGCCPLPEAVCCPDREHCCPKGYKCDLRRQNEFPLNILMEMATLSCDLSSIDFSVNSNGSQIVNVYLSQVPIFVLVLSLTPLFPLLLLSLKAECCDDMKHCCPAGYKCGEGGICTSDLSFDWKSWKNWRVFFSKKKRASTL